MSAACNQWHAARPRPSAEGKRPSRGTVPCAVCGEPVHRVGKFIASDGVRGTWAHVARKAVAK